MITRFKKRLANAGRRTVAAATWTGLGVAVLGAAGAATIGLGVWRLAAPTNESGIARSAAVANLMTLGQSFRDDIARVVRPAIDRTRMLAVDPEVVAALGAGDAARQTAACNRAIRQSTEIDAVATFDADGRIRAINTVYADGLPIAPERIARILGMNFAGRDIVQRCANNGASQQALEFQTTCDITPALFDSTGLSVAYSMPVLDPATGRKLGVVSTRLRFERLTSLVRSGMPVGVEFVTDRGTYFSESINAGTKAPPVTPSVLQGVVGPLVRGDVDYTFTRAGPMYLSLFRLKDFTAIDGGGIQVMLLADDDWLDREARHGKLWEGAAVTGGGLLLAATAALLAGSASRRRSERKLVQAQKLESIGQLAAGIAHEINTPTQYVGDNTRFVRDGLSGLLSLLDRQDGLLGRPEVRRAWPDEVAAIEHLRERCDVEFLREEIPRALDQSIAGVDSIATIVRAMKDFSHPGGEEPAPADLNASIRSTAMVCRNRWKYVAELEMDLDPALPDVRVMLGEFNQVMLNLIVNAADAIASMSPEACQAVPAGVAGRIRVRTRPLAGGRIEVSVSDNGPGIPEAIKNRIFEPFFTTKPVGKGTGQGLMLCRNVVVNKHGGELFFQSASGGGTTFIVRLPVGNADAAQKQMKGAA